jgi:D-inositol-3-phosphate glycosyltransferase
MNIAFISEHASPLAALGGVDSGGQNVYVAQVAAHLAARGHQIDIFTRWDNAALPEVVTCQEGIRVIHVEAGPKQPVPKEDLLPFMDQFGEKMAHFIRRKGQSYRLIHAHFFMSALVASKLRKVLGIPFVVTFHALGKVRIKHQGGADRFPRERFAIEEGIMRDAARVIAECPQDRLDMREHYGADDARMSIIPCGFNPTEFYPMDREEACRVLDLDPNRRYLLQLGRMVPRKGVETVIRGFARFLRTANRDDMDLLIVGGESKDPDPVRTPELGRLMGIAREEGVAERVIFTGQRDRDMLKYYYNAAEIFASTPWYEPFGITPLESMACGTPVIGARVGGIQYTVVHNQTGLLIPPKDPLAFAGALTRLMNNAALREQMGRQAIERVNRHFTWATVADQLEAVYREVNSVRGIAESRDWGLVTGDWGSRIQSPTSNL